MDETRETNETLDIDSNSEESLAAWETPAAGEAYAAKDVADWDAVGTKLDLAKAYMEMGEGESARDLLMEVTREGSSAQQEEARQLLKTL